ncbi:MAG: AAA family ATPase [Mesorhizobium sp.]|uniref:AAA family ATPase n=1 Tax=Mesorhizobium sp. TaxID=1871066 RepID=UPI000FE40578|nr:AAA family ATPase [Mesorhizobium sp.]RWK14633.1 MAG: AAA family ATPase [Mesorhizobium sp.]RWK28825.1 MAG: AAA family ATPase [Mesorhizobium sp.]
MGAIAERIYKFEPGKPAPEIPVPANDNGRGRLVFIGEDAPYVPKPELVRDTMPRTGVGFYGGQSGAYKTFFAIHSATCFMTGEPLAGRDIERTGGVVYWAAEGEGTISGRLKARRAQLQDPDELLPFYLLTEMGALTDKASYAALEARLVQAAASMRERFDVPLVALIIDTVSAAGMIAEDKENDPGSWQKVFDALQPIAKRLDCVIILIHHAGKNASAGLRGSSNARAGADFALMLACDRDEITGLTANHYLHLAKSRDAPEGPIAAITASPAQIGVRDDGSPITTLVLDFDTSGKAPTKKPKASKTDRPFRDGFMAALADRGQTVRVHGDPSAPDVMAVLVEDARAEFAARYVTAQVDEAKRADTVRKQFKSAVERAVQSGEFCAGSWDGKEWIWKTSEPER